MIILKVLLAVVILWVLIILMEVVLFFIHLDEWKIHFSLILAKYNGPFETININGMVMYLIYSPMTLKTTRSLYCRVTTDRLDRIIILYDKGFNKLTSKEKEAIIYHEAGHMALKHSYTKRILDQELEADAYSAKYVGAEYMISALNKMSKILFADRKELKIRINALKA
jgi:hypothetical protein